MKIINFFPLSFTRQIHQTMEHQWSRSRAQFQASSSPEELQWPLLGCWSGHSRAPLTIAAAGPTIVQIITIKLPNLLHIATQCLLGKSQPGAVLFRINNA
jgi:hypothetical protein